MAFTFRRRLLSADRALVCDVLHYDRRIPSFAHSRTFALAEVEQLRRRAPQRTSWSLLFLKAYAQLSAECPVLRQALIEFPFPHSYQHPDAIGTLAVSRLHHNRPRLFWPRFKHLATRTLSELQADLEHHQHAPVEQLFRRQLRFSRLPTPLRRVGWWMTFNLSGNKRATRLGTFALTTLSGQGVTIDRPPSIHTSTLTYGPLDERGHSQVTIVYDHRLMDGLTIAGCLVRLEEILHGPIAAELKSLDGSPTHSHAHVVQFKPGLRAPHGRARR